MVQACAAPKNVEPPVDMGALLKFATETVIDLRECRARHKTLSEWAKKQ